MRLLYHHKTKGVGLLKSSLYNETSFYKQFTRDLRRAKKKIIIEGPYLTERRALQFAKLFKKLNKRGVKTIIYTRHPKSHGKLLEIQSWLAIRVLKENRVKVMLCSDLRHRKLAIIDNEILWEGSLNILSQCNSREVMRRTQSPSLCKQMLHFTGINRWKWWYTGDDV